jgi:hypothetical protein
MHLFAAFGTAREEKRIIERLTDHKAQAPSTTPIATKEANRSSLHTDSHVWCASFL